MILDLKDNISIFRDSVEKQADSSKLNNGKEIFKMGVENQFYVKKNLAQKRVEKVITYLRTDYLLPIEEILNWKITSRTKNDWKISISKSRNYLWRKKLDCLVYNRITFQRWSIYFQWFTRIDCFYQDSNNDYSFNLIEVKKGGNIF
jgi:hypothetical protein